MTAGTNDIYVDVDVHAISNWESYIPTVFRIGTASNGYKSILTEVRAGTTSSGSDNINVEAYMDPTFIWSPYDISTLFVLASGTSSGTNDVNIDFNLTNEATLSDSSKVIITTFIQGNLDYIRNDDIQIIYSVPSYHDYFNYDIKTDFKIYSGSVHYTNDTTVDLSLAEMRGPYTTAELFNSALEVKDITADIELESGRLAIFNSDVWSTVSGVPYKVNTDLFNTSEDLSNYCYIDIDLVSGTLSIITTDIFSSVVTSGTIGCDIRTWSLNVGDFFIGPEEFTTASSVAWVDITDELYAISTANSYFLVDEVRVGVTFSVISNGYRMYYDPPNDFYSRGTLTYSVHAENVVGDTITRNYYLLYGYNANFNSIIDWGYNKTVVVWATAKNLAYCPNTEADSYYFRTKNLWYRDLGASIVPVGFADLGATIHTQGKVFYYGGTYTITISGVKDFYGNEMETKRFTFTIEDPTN